MTINTKGAKRSHLRAMAMTILVLCGTGAASAGSWTTVGSAGTVDDGSIGKVAQSSGVVSMRYDAPDVAFGYIRYPVRSAYTPIFSSCPKNWTMRVTYSDNGPGSRIILRLKRVEMYGRTSTLATWDSNSWDNAAHGGYRTNTISMSGFLFDFDQNAYYIEALLAKYDSSGKPKLLKIHVDNDPLACIPG